MYSKLNNIVGIILMKSNLSLITPQTYKTKLIMTSPHSLINIKTPLSKEYSLKIISKIYSHLNSPPLISIEPLTLTTPAISSWTEITYPLYFSKLKTTTVMYQLKKLINSPETSTYIKLMVYSSQSLPASLKNITSKSISMIIITYSYTYITWTMMNIKYKLPLISSITSPLNYHSAYHRRYQ